MTESIHEELRDLIAAYALDAISDEERAIVDGHLADCAACRDDYAQHLEALATLTPDASRAGDSDWEAVRARIVAPATPSWARVIPFPQRVVRRVAGVAAVAACSVLATLALTRDPGEGTPVRTAAVVPTPEAAAVAGSVRLYSPSVPAGHVRLRLDHVPDAPPGHHYEVWVLRPGAATEMEPIGAFTPEHGRVDLTLSLPGPGQYVALDISIQQDGGSPEHSGRSLAGARF
ncbi:MAG: anti-sigma factor [Gaiellales bacterium]